MNALKPRKMPAKKPIKAPPQPAPQVKPAPRFLALNAPDITEAEIQAVTDVLRSGWLSSGNVTKTLEEEFAREVGAAYAVAVSSCTMGMILSMIVLNVGDGTEVITTPLTFAATLNAILAVRSRPILVDVDEHGNLDPEHIRFRLTNNTKAILPVHYLGAAARMQEIMHNAQAYGLHVIEDAACAFGGQYVAHPKPGEQSGARKAIGTIADTTCFSLYANKNISGAEGGMVTTKRGDLAERMRVVASQGLTSGAWKRYGNGAPQHYEVLHVGQKGNLSDVHAAIALTQLRRWAEIRRKRGAVWNIYEDAFGFKEPGHSQHLFTIRVKNREHFRRRLWEEGIGTGIHYSPLHLEPAYRFLGYKRGDFPNAERIGDETVSLPISAKMTEEDAHRVVEIVKRVREGNDGN
jgi:dTDP-4-amino-4,6-dideoxygalactose transaminase